MKTTLDKIIISFSTILILYVTYSALTKDKISQDNLEFVVGQVVKIDRIKPKNSWSVSYNIQLANNANTHKILPQYADCINTNVIKKLIGKLVIIGIDPDHRNVLTLRKSVVSLKNNQQEYLSLECINAAIGKNKILIPAIVISAIIVLFMIRRGNKKILKN